MSLHFLSFLCLFLPSGGDGLPLGVELDCTLAVEVAHSSEGAFASSEGEHRQRHRDGQVDTNLSGIDLVLELASGVTILGEDGSTVTVLVAVDQVDGLLQGVGSHDDHHGSEDLLVVHVHAWGHVVDHSGAHEVALLIAWHLHASAV